MIRTLRDIPKKELKDKRVLLRVDFEVPVVRGRIEDDFRIRATLPTIRYLLNAGARILLLTKRGHFNISRTPAMSTKILIPYLERLLKIKIKFLKDLPALKKFVEKDNFCLFLFENLRFWKEEETNSPAFARKFAKIADLYVSDNFGTAHRAHASVATLPRFLPAYTGFLLEQEVKILDQIRRKPITQFAALLGGAKLETKLPLIRRFLRNGGIVLLGGAPANERLPHHSRLLFPQDGARSGGQLVDIGPQTVQQYSRILRRARTIFWNGPMGKVEKRRYQAGTIAIARVLQRCQGFKVVGGGDTVAFLEERGLLKKFDHISTGGGAMLEFLAGKKLPGIEALKKHKILNPNF